MFIATNDLKTTDLVPISMWSMFTPIKHTLLYQVEVVVAPSGSTKWSKHLINSTNTKPTH